MPRMIARRFKVYSDQIEYNTELEISPEEPEPEPEINSEFLEIH